MGRTGERTAAKPMIIHFPAVAFDIVVFRTAFCDFEVFAWDDDIGGVGAAGPLLAVGTTV